MKLADEMLQTLERALAGAPVPRVRALHLPPAPWGGSKAGEFCAIELDDGSLGLSYVLLDGALEALAADSPGAALQGADALAVARGWAQGQGAARALGFAAVNALTRHLFDRAGYGPPPAVDSTGGLAPKAGERVGMVGYFKPLVGEVLASGAQLTVLELRPELAGPREGHRVTLDARELAGCSKILSTSTVLLNDSLDDLLAHCAAAREFALIGPGASCLPDPLFRRGVTLLGGVWVDEGPAFTQALVAGRAWGRHAHKFALARAQYPGIDALPALPRQ